MQATALALGCVVDADCVLHVTQCTLAACEVFKSVRKKGGLDPTPRSGRGEHEIRREPRRSRPGHRRFAAKFACMGPCSLCTPCCACHVVSKQSIPKAPETNGSEAGVEAPTPSQVEHTQAGKGHPLSQTAHHSGDTRSLQAHRELNQFSTEELRGLCEER